MAERHHGLVVAGLGDERRVIEVKQVGPFPPGQSGQGRTGRGEAQQGCEDESGARPLHSAATKVAGAGFSRRTGAPMR